MEDKQIVDLYWSRDENAITQSVRKYGRYCSAIAQNITQNREDSEECVSETWLRAWNTMPTNRPSLLNVYLAKLTRWISLDYVRKRNADKRNAEFIPEAWDELSKTLDAGINIESEVEQRELAEYLAGFISAMPEKQKNIFIARYWYMASVSEIAKAYGCSEGKIKMMLMRSRKALKKHLEECGLC